MKLSFYHILNISASVVCSIVFLLMSISQFEVFSSEPTGTSLKWKSINDMPFPAMSICDSHFEYGKAWVDLGLPLNMFGKPPQDITENPLDFYEKLKTFDYMDKLGESLWKHHFNLNKIMSDYTRDKKYGNLCSIGSKSCSPPPEASVTLPTDVTATLELEVEAGTWKSRFLADSKEGTTFMCHTLVPNVTVDFTLNEGNIIQIKWDRIFIKRSNFWTIYLHDKNEHVLLKSHAIESLPLIKFAGQDADNMAEDDVFKKKAKIVPRLQVLPEPSDVLPCNDSLGYSINYCNLEWGWMKKYDAMKDYHGDAFACTIPGVITNSSYYMPICQHFHPNDTSLGLEGILKVQYDDTVRHGSPSDYELMTKPPVGIYKDTSGCVKRCSSYTYQIVEETIAKHDKDMLVHDLFMYFASTTVETWEEYRLQSALDYAAGMGGSLGLMLGLSVISIFMSLVDVFTWAMQLSSKYLRISHRDLKQNR